MSSEESLRRAQELLDRLERSRRELEATSEPERAIEILGELSEIAKEVEVALNRAKLDADAES